MGCDNWLALPYQPWKLPSLSYRGRTLQRLCSICDISYSMEIEIPTGKRIPYIHRGGCLFFIGSIDFLHTFTFRGGMELFPGSGINLTVQLWIAARYLESITFLLAPLFLIKRKEDVNPDVEKRYIISPDSSTFAWNVFLVYAAITILCLLSIFFFRNFPAAILKVRELLLLKF